MAEWRRLFASHILERGKYYYDIGAVKSLERTKSGYEAEVEGCEMYHVKIDISEDSIHDMYCSCPYAQDGHACKHMAAVLFKVENDLVSDDLMQWIDSLSKEELCSFLKKIVKRNPSVVRSYFDCEGYKNRIEDIVYSHTDKYGSIDYHHADSFAYEMKSFLTDGVHECLERHQIVKAFEVVLQVFDVISKVEIDDSNGCVCELMQTCFKMWKDIYSLGDESERQCVVEKMRSYKGSEDFKEYVEEFLLFECKVPELLIQKMAEIDYKIHSGNFTTVFRTMYDSLHPVLFRLELMGLLEFPAEDAEMYMEKYKFLPEVRWLEIENNIESGNTILAISLLKESKIKDADNVYWVKKYCEQLISLYESLDRMEEYKEELTYCVTQLPVSDLAFVYKLKKVCSENEWNLLLDKIIGCMSGAFKYKFFSSEKMYESLLDLIVKNEDIYAMDRYMDVLKDIFPDRLIAFYIDFLNEEVRFAQNRKAYRSLMQYLKKVSLLKNGREAACSLAEQWRKVYVRRPAMIDELNKIGLE